MMPDNKYTCFTLKNGESYKVSGLPAGAKFILTEKDHGRAKRLDAGFTNVEESDLNGWTVKGRTRTVWQESPEATKLSVVELVNDYTLENKILGDHEPKKEEPEDKTINKYDDKNKGNVKTGDNSHVMGWIAGCCLTGTDTDGVFPHL